MMESGGDSDSIQVKTAAILLIGNELLSAKIKDENAFYLCQRLRELGVLVQRVLLIPDHQETIAQEVRELSEKFDFVFTSGGVGPTHDDITLESIAYAFGEELLLDEQLHLLLKDYFKEKLNTAHLRMAHIPANSELLWTKDSSWPVYSYRNIYILPGVPQVFRAKFESIAQRFRSGSFYLRSLYLNTREGGIAEILQTVEEEFNVQIGSYPNVQGVKGFKVRVTVEARNAEPVNLAVDRLIILLEERCQLGKLKISASKKSRYQRTKKNRKKHRRKRTSSILSSSLSLIARVDAPV